MKRANTVKVACSSCGVRGERSKNDYMIRCPGCRRSWHGQGCMIEGPTEFEMLQRNNRYMANIVEDSWGDWRCRECLGIGPQGVPRGLNALSASQNPSRQPTPNQSQNRSHDQSQNQHQRQIQATSKTAATINIDLTTEVDLTLESDSEPEIMIVDAPSTRRAKVPALKPPVSKPPAPTPPTSKLPGSDTAPSNPLQAPHDEIDLISPEQTPPREIEDNPLQYLPTPELQVPPTPELRYPSEQSIDPIQSRSHSLVPGFGAMRLGARTPNTHPAFPIVEPTPFTHRLGPPDPPCQSQPQLLPPALRPSQGSILGEHLLKATSESRAVRIIGVPELKANGWIFEKREQEVEVQSITKNKGKGRALGERTRDWTPLVQREERARVAEREHASGQPPAAQKRNVFCLIPPPKETPKTAWAPALYPSRQPRKRAAVKKGPTVPTVKVEDTPFYLVS